jgi:hypothetical protein
VVAQPRRRRFSVGEGDATAWDIGVARPRRATIAAASIRLVIGVVARARASKQDRGKHDGEHEQQAEQPGNVEAGAV